MKPRQPGSHPQVPMPAEGILDDERLFRKDGRASHEARFFISPPHR